MKKELQICITLLLSAVLFSFHVKKSSEEKHRLQGWWKDEVSKTFLLIKGNKALEYKISESQNLSKTHYKILKINKGIMELKRIRVKSTSFPFKEGAYIIYDCTIENENSFLCRVKLKNSTESEISKTRFFRINETEFEEFVELFNDKYRNCLASNWGNPVN